MTARHRAAGRPSYPTALAVPLLVVDKLGDGDDARRRVVATAAGTAVMVALGAGPAAAWSDSWSGQGAVTSAVWAAPQVALVALPDQLAQASWPALGGEGITYTAEQRINGGAWTALASGPGVLSAQVSAPGGASVEVRVAGSIAGQPGPVGQATLVLPIAAPIPALTFASPTVAQVTWAGVSGASSYRLEASLDGGPWQVIREDYAGWQQWSVHAGQDVAVRVRADNGTTYSPWSATVRARSPFTNSASPIGVLDSATRTGSTITLSGWALDQDGTVPIGIHAYTAPGTDSSNIIQRGAATVATANLSRPDIAAAYPGMGAAHGFTITVPAPATPSTVCLYGIDHTSLTAGSNNPLLACVTL